MGDLWETCGDRLGDQLGADDDDDGDDDDDAKKWVKNGFPAVFRPKIGRKVKMAIRNRGVRY